MTPFQRMVIGLLLITVLAIFGMLLILVIQPNQQPTLAMAPMPIATVPATANPTANPHINPQDLPKQCVFGLFHTIYVK